MNKKIGLVFLSFLVLALCLSILLINLSCATTKGSKSQFGLKSNKLGQEDQGGSGSWFFGISSSVKTQELIGGVAVVITVGASLFIIRKIISRNK